MAPTPPALFTSTSSPLPHPLLCPQARPALSLGHWGAVDSFLPPFIVVCAPTSFVAHRGQAIVPSAKGHGEI